MPLFGSVYSPKRPVTGQNLRDGYGLVKVVVTALLLESTLRVIVLPDPKRRTVASTYCFATESERLASSINMDAKDLGLRYFGPDDDFFPATPAALLRFLFLFGLPLFLPPPSPSSFSNSANSSYSSSSSPPIAALSVTPSSISMWIATRKSFSSSDDDPPAPPSPYADDLRALSRRVRRRSDARLATPPRAEEATPEAAAEAGRTAPALRIASFHAFL
mmetsp:Transcript_26694/g.46388  ORF Transcript_26694/g.46388 Transcript_26694/m.46388 type:complete len:219 (-) Transcript_26694:83-739(-)